jgi:competence protein ComEA
MDQACISTQWTSTSTEERTMKRIRTWLTLLVCVLVCPVTALAGPVDVNSADAATISAELQGVGMVKAQAIVDYRDAHGPFKSVDDRVLVKGIASRTVEINRANILLAPAQGQGRD